MKNDPHSILQGNPLHAMEALMDAVRWIPVEAPPDAKSEDKYSTHYGEFTVGEFKFRCYQLNDGQRVIHQEDVARFMQAFPPANGDN